MKKPGAVFWVTVFGLLLPFLARLPGAALHGSRWLRSYVDVSLEGFLFLEAFNLIAVIAAAAATALFNARSTWLLPVALGYGYVAWQHGTLDLGADAQAALGLVFIPIYSVPFFIVGALVAIPLSIRHGRQRREPLAD